MDELVELCATPVVARLAEGHQGQRVTKGAFVLALLLKMGRLDPGALESCYAAFEALDRNGDGSLDLGDIRRGESALSAGENPDYLDEEDPGDIIAAIPPPPKLPRQATS